MSIEAITWALSADVGSATRKLVLIGYANHAHKDGRNAWVGKETVADYVNVDERTVRRQVTALVAGGWMREGDQDQVAGIRADRRPVVYEVAMTDVQRARWAAAAAAGDSSHASETRADPWWDEPGTGGQPVPPSRRPRPVTLSPRQNGHGGTDGGTESGPRGDIAVSPEPSGTKEPSPQPPASGGPAPSATTSASTAPCPAHAPVAQPHCRGCGTTSRQLAATAERDADEQRRVATLDAWRAESERRRAAATPPPPGLADRVRRDLALPSPSPRSAP